MKSEWNSFDVQIDISLSPHLSLLLDGNKLASTGNDERRDDLLNQLLLPSSVIMFPKKLRWWDVSRLEDFFFCGSKRIWPICISSYTLVLPFIVAYFMYTLNTNHHHLWHSSSAVRKRADNDDTAMMMLELWIISLKRHWINLHFIWLTNLKFLSRRRRQKVCEFIINSACSFNGYHFQSADHHHPHLWWWLFKN